MPEYRDIPGYPGYRAGSDGTLWTSWARQSLGGRRGTRSYIGTTYSQMKTPLDVKGYPHTQLRTSLGKYRMVRLHVAVLLAFLGPPPEGCEGCHADGVRTNCALSNLRWGSHASNMADMARHGTSNRGLRNPNVKLTEAQVLQIRKRCRLGEPKKDVASEFGIHLTYLYALLAGKFWGWLKDPDAGSD